MSWKKVLLAMMEVGGGHKIPAPGHPSFFHTLAQRPLKVHVVSETEFMTHGHGLYTACVDQVELLRAKPDLEVVVNQHGWGDLMHAHTHGPYYFWKGRRYRGRRIYTVHVIPDSIKGTLPAWRLLMPLARWYFRRVYSHATVCIAVSPAVEKAIRELGVKTRIVRIPNIVHKDKFAPSAERRAEGRKLLGLGPHEFVVLGVGTIEGRKGVEDFLDIAAACPELTFVWVGGRPRGVMTEGLIRISARIVAAGPNVKFAGLYPLEKMPLLYNAADLFLFPSHQETFGLAPLEAAAAGLPVIFRDLPVYASLHESPYLKAKDTDEFISLTRSMATNERSREEGRVISRQLLEQYDKEEVRRRLLELYREVLGLPKVVRPS